MAKEHIFNRVFTHEEIEKLNISKTLWDKFEDFSWDKVNYYCILRAWEYKDSISSIFHTKTLLSNTERIKQEIINNKNQELCKTFYDFLTILEKELVIWVLLENIRECNWEIPTYDEMLSMCNDKGYTFEFYDIDSVCNELSIVSGIEKEDTPYLFDIYSDALDSIVHIGSFMECYSVLRRHYGADLSIEGYSDRLCSNFSEFCDVTGYDELCDDHLHTLHTIYISSPMGRITLDYVVLKNLI